MNQMILTMEVEESLTDGRHVALERMERMIRSRSQSSTPEKVYVEGVERSKESKSNKNLFLDIEHNIPGEQVVEEQNN